MPIPEWTEGDEQGPGHGKMGAFSTTRVRRRLYEILDHGGIGDRTGAMVGRLIVLLIVINLVAVTLEVGARFACAA